MTGRLPAKSARSAKVDALAIAIDTAIDAADRSTLETLDKRCAAMLKASTEEEARLWYYRSNVQAALQDNTDAHSGKWRQPHRERQILYLRRSKANTGFAALGPEVRAQILTNLANTLNSLGRSIEALQLYDQALDQISRFAMALGNRGIARAELARQLYDGNAIVLMQAAAVDIERALAPDAFWDNDYPSAIDLYQRWLDWLTAVIARNEPRAIDLDGFSLGRTKTEKRYRRWALDNQLFLSPLSVLGPHAIAAADPFGLPPHRGGLDEPPHFIAWYNQMKQEFAAARLMLFERNRPDVRAAERDYAAAVAGVGVSTAQLYPSLTLAGTVTATGTNTWGFGPTLSIPVLNRPSLLAARDQSKAQAEQARLAWQASVLGAVEDVQSAQSAYLRSLREVSSLRSSVNAYTRVTDLSQQTYEGGTTTLSDLLDGQRSLASARLSLAASVRDMAANWASLQVSAGRGWATGPAVSG